MTTEQALEILRQLALLAPVNYQTHDQGNKAYEVIKKELLKEK